MEKIEVYKIMKPNTIIGINKEMKIKSLPFILNNNTIEILEYVNNWDYIRLIIPASYKNITVTCQMYNN